MKRTLSVRKVSKGNATHVEIDLYYSKGGMNYFTGNVEPRGIYISVSPVIIGTFGTNGVTKSFSAFSGIKQCLYQMNRFNQKTLDTFEVEQVKIDELLSVVLNKNHLELEALEK